MSTTYNRIRYKISLEESQIIWSAAYLYKGTYTSTRKMPLIELKGSKSKKSNLFETGQFMPPGGEGHDTTRSAMDPPLCINKEAHRILTSHQSIISIVI